MAVSVAVCEIFSVKKWCDLENEKIAFLYERLWRETNGETNGQTDGQNQRVKLRKGGLIIIRRTLGYVRLMGSVARLSSVCCLWRWCTVRRELNFTAIFAPSSSLGLGQLVLKFWKKIEWILGDWLIVQVKWKGDMKNWRFSINVSLYFENGTRYSYSYNGKTIVTRIYELSIGAIFDDLERPLTRFEGHANIRRWIS